MLDQPEVAQAALSGELSAEQAQAVSAGAEANPARTAELLEAAREKSMAELNEAVAKARSEAVDLELHDLDRSGLLRVEGLVGVVRQPAERIGGEGRGRRQAPDPGGERVPRGGGP